MYKMSNSINYLPRRQRGISLIEALISLLIIAITTAGSLYIVSRANVTKTQMSMQQIAVAQMRNLLMNHGSPGVNACALDNKLDLPGVADGDQPLISASGTCAEPAGAAAVKIQGVNVNAGTIETPATMPGRIILTAIHNDKKNILAADIVVGGS